MSTHWDVVGVDDGNLGGVVQQFSLSESPFKSRFHKLREGRRSFEGGHFAGRFVVYLLRKNQTSGIRFQGDLAWLKDEG